MSPPNLPPELLDHIADFLCDSSDALKSCCLVSKSWIPRARKHLFADIQFRTIDDLESWEAIFPEPSTSPACYTKTLYINYYNVTTAAAAQEDCSVSAFSSVVHLTVNTLKTSSSPMAFSLAPFHGFSLALKSLRLVFAIFTPSQIFDLICSFPLLEDLSLHTTVHVPTKDGDFKKRPAIIQPSNLPAFTGSLTLSARHGMDPFVSRLLSLPNDLHFRNLDLAWYLAADVSSSTELVEGCCSTLESLKIHGYALDPSQPAQVKLSKATKLKDVTLKCSLHTGWILKTLRTVTCDHTELERIVLTVVSSQGLGDSQDVKYAVGESVYREWLELDRVLAQLCESHSIRVKVVCDGSTDTDESRERRRMEVLLPEAMARGVVDLVEWRE